MFQQLKNELFNKMDTDNSNISMNPTTSRTFNDLSQPILPHFGSNEQFKFKF